MKDSYKLLIALSVGFIFMRSVAAQAPASGEALGFFRLVQATGVPGKLTVQLDADDLQPEGYLSGQCTGAIGFPAKTYQLKVHHPVLGELRLAMPLKPGDIKTLVLFTEIELPKPGQSPNPDHPPKPVLKHYILESPAEDKAKGHHITLLQCTSRPSIDFDLAGHPLTVLRLTPILTQLTKKMGEFPVISVGGAPIRTLNFKDPQDMVVIFFLNETGAMKSVSFGNSL